MFNFIICEEDFAMRKIIKNIVNDYILERNLKAKIAIETSCPFEVVDYVKLNNKNKKIYIFWILYQMKI